MRNTELEQKYLIPEIYTPIPKFEDVVPIPSDKEVILWRYLDIAKLITLMSQGKLHLTRADVFKDKHEGSITNPMSRAQRKQFKGKSFNIESLSIWRKKLKESTFISCWCIGTIESEAMWELYCGDKYGVAITATYQNIEANLPDSKYIMAPVKYIDYQTDGFPLNHYGTPFFHKRLAFTHEREVRIVRIATDQYDDGSIPASYSDPPTDTQRAQLEKGRQIKVQLKAERGKCIFINMDIINTIQEIVVHPDAPEWYSKVVREVVEKFAPKLRERVRWSSMRSEPVF